MVEFTKQDLISILGLIKSRDEVNQALALETLKSIRVKKVLPQLWRIVSINGRKFYRYDHKATVRLHHIEIEIRNFFKGISNTQVNQLLSFLERYFITVITKEDSNRLKYHGKEKQMSVSNYEKNCFWVNEFYWDLNFNKFGVSWPNRGREVLLMHHIITRKGGLAKTNLRALNGESINDYPFHSRLLYRRSVWLRDIMIEKVKKNFTKYGSEKLVNKYSRSLGVTKNKLVTR